MTSSIKKELLTRRENFFKHMLPNSVALFFAAPEAVRSNDTHYPYRQNSDFWYLTLFNEPESVLLLIKEQNNDCRSILINRDKDPLLETWTGFRLGQQAALDTAFVDEAYPFSKIESHLVNIIDGKTAVYHADSLYTYADEIVKNVIASLRLGARQKRRSPNTFIDWRSTLHEMRMFKSNYEIALMRKAGEISAQAHLRAMQKCRPGMYEYQLEAEILHEFSRHGSRWPSYNTIVGGGNNGCTLHYETNSDTLQDGDLVLIDAGCEYQNYAGDITRTFPVNGKFSQAQRDIYDIVLESQLHAIKYLKPDTSIQEVNQQVIKIIVQGLVKLGIMHGNVDELIEQKAYLAYYMHGLGHWLGIDVHDVGLERDCLLKPGMVLTVEPGLYITKNADVPDCYKGIGIRIEDNLLITQTGNEVLTHSVPKHPDEIEKLIAQCK